VSLATIGLAALILGAVGLAFAGLIGLVHRRFAVWEDPRIEGAVSLLPGNNCGACGLPGCRGFAEAVVGGTVKPAQCTVLSADGVDELAAYLGVDAGEANKRVARLACGGGSDMAVMRAQYVGLQTCKAAAAVAGGGKGCPWACLGLADCERACTFDAIFMNPVGLPVVVPEKCTACNDCVVACPRDLFSLQPLDQKLIVQCRSLLAGEQAEALCRVACNACGRCVADAAPGLISIVDNLAVVDYAKNKLATAAATARCPTDSIVWVEGQQFDPARTTPAGRLGVPAE